MPYASSTHKKVIEFRRSLNSQAFAKHVKICVREGRPLISLGMDHWTEFTAPFPEEIFPPRIVLTADVRLTDFHVSAAGELVSDRFREIIERFDPCIHQFVPVKVQMKDGREYEDKSFYFYQNLQLLNTVDPTGLDVMEGPGNMEKELWPLNLSLFEKFATKKDKIGGAGAWREMRATYTVLYSDRILDAFQTEKIDGWDTQYEFDEI
ncbi:MAG: DUF1629 domain-containing protein [Pseudomonadota bacterium]